MSLLQFLRLPQILFVQASILLSVFSVTLLMIPPLQAAPITLTKLEVPQPAPNFRLIDLDNTVHTLADYKGKPLIVNFWASWCRPCRDELPAFNRAWAKVKNQGVQMIAINIGEDPTAVFSFIKQYPIDFRILLDPESNELANWQMKGLPTTYILNAEGKVVYQAIGEREWDHDKLLAKVLALRNP